MGTHSLNILKRDISYFRNGRVPFKIGPISYLEIVISLEITGDPLENKKFLPHLYRGISATFYRRSTDHAVRQDPTDTIHTNTIRIRKYYKHYNKAVVTKYYRIKRLLHTFVFILNTNTLYYSIGFYQFHKV